MALNWTEIGSAVGLLLSGAGASFLATRKKQPLQEEPDMLPPPLKRRASDHLPCNNCTVDEDMSELRQEMNEGIHALHLKLNSVEAIIGVHASKAENTDANVSELFTLVRQLSADVNKTLGKLEVMQSRT